MSPAANAKLVTAPPRNWSSEESAKWQWAQLWFVDATCASIQSMSLWSYYGVVSYVLVIKSSTTAPFQFHLFLFIWCFPEKKKEKYIILFDLPPGNSVPFQFNCQDLSENKQPSTVDSSYPTAKYFFHFTWCKNKENR